MSEQRSHQSTSDSDSTDSTAPPRLEASIVVDVASLRHRLIPTDDGTTEEADTGPTRRGRHHDRWTSNLSELDLPGLVGAVTDLGLGVKELWVAAPFIPVRLGTGGDKRRATQYASETYRWWKRQSSNLQGSRHRSVRTRPLWGATDGEREVGVDVMVAAAALEAARGLERSAIPGVVLVFSHDTDMFDLYRCSPTVPIVVAGSFESNERKEANKQGAPRLHISRDVLRSAAEWNPGSTVDERKPFGALRRLGPDRSTWPEGTAVVEGATEGDLVHVRPNGDVVAVTSDDWRKRTAAEAERVRAVDAPTRVVADPYGIMNGAIRSIGVACLPDPESIETIVAGLGWSPPFSVLATIPDVSPYHQSMDQARRRAWWIRDSELDALASTFDNDDDPATVQRRALLKPARVEDRRSFDRDVSARAIKRLATGMMADLWHAVSATTDGHVVLMSEDPDLAYALEHLGASRVDRYRDVTRVGLHANRYEVLPHDGSQSPKRVRLPFTVLPDVTVAMLCRVVDRPYGHHLRSALAHALSSKACWTVRGTDPETNSITVETHTTVSTSDGPGSDATTAGTSGPLVARLFRHGRRRPDDQLDPGSEPVRFHIAFDPASPCAHPVLDDGPASRFELMMADVVAHTGVRVDIDVDHDGVPDGTVPVGHTTGICRPSAQVTVALNREKKAWHLVDAGELVGDHAQPEAVELVGRHGDLGRVRALDEAEGLAEPPPGSRTILGVEGDRYLGVRRTLPDGTTRWLLLSSPLRHLKRD